MKINNNFNDKKPEIEFQKHINAEEEPLFELSAKGADASNDIEYVTNADGSVTALLKDEDGNITYDVTVNSEGKTISETTYLDDGNIDTYTEYDGSDDKNIILKSDFSYTYDDNGTHVLCESDFNSDGKVDLIDEWAFSPDGNITNYKSTSDSNSDGVFDEKYQIEYDTDGNPVNVKSNFEIDNSIDNSKQGALGDCYLLSGLNSLSYGDNGRNLIEKSVIENADGSYNVNFQGAGEVYTITEEELALARENGNYSSGDNTVLLFEIAFEKALTNVKENPEKYPKEITDIINADTSNLKQYAGSVADYGNMDLFCYFMTGEKARTIYADENFESISELLNNFNAEHEMINVNFTDNNGKEYSVFDVEGNSCKLLSAHSWSLKSADNDNITVVNPWNSSEEITFNRNELEKYIKFIETAKIPKM